MKIKDRFSVVCEGITYEGLGVCKVDNMVVFVDNLITDEEAVIEIEKVKKKYAFANVIEIKKKSSQRVKPLCDAYYKCGGCNLSHMSEELKVSTKYDGVVNSLRKKSCEAEVINCIEDSDMYGYRNKVILHAQNKGDNIIVGPYGSGSYNVCTNDCLMLNDTGRELHLKIVELLNLHEVKAYDYKTKGGVLRDIMYRRNEQDQYMIVFIVGRNNNSINKVIEEIKNDENVISIVVSVNKGSRHEVLSSQSSVIYGSNHLVYDIGVKYNVYANSFFQVNTNVMEKMYQVIKGNIDEGSNVLDAYSGVGSISLYIASVAKNVIGIEINEFSHKNAVQNKMLNDIKNVKFINGDISDEVSRMKKKCDTIITDPPRNGCSKELIEFIINSDFKKMIYMSCNSATLARDIELLSDSYHVEKVYVFDMFAHTSHAECIAILNRI